MVVPFSKTDNAVLKMFEATDLELFSKIGSMIRLFWEFFWKHRFPGLLPEESG